MTEKIDVHHTAAKYATALARLDTNNEITAANKAHIRTFLHDCQLGKTVLGREKKRIREKRLLKYLSTLRNLSHWFDHTDFATISQAQMETFITSLEANQLTLRRNGTARPVQYAAWTQRDIKVCLKKFYKWLLGDNQAYPPLVAWVDTHIQTQAPPSLTLDEIRMLVEYAPTTRGKAFVWSLFESGARAEEFLNIRVGHVTGHDDPCLVAIDYPKTYKRSLLVFEGHRYLQAWLVQHPTKDDADAQLFPVTYGAMRMFLRRLGERALGKRVHPHLLRHSFATWLAAKKVGRYQMCKLMGWAMSSDMPDQYIDRVGVVEAEAIAAIRGDDLAKTEQENDSLRTALRRLEAQTNALQERVSRRDHFLNQLFQDERLVEKLAQAIERRGLDAALLRL